ncbi:1-phosphofructokinase [Lacticaseibacillus chiayiensis]|uniref:1-phosphofructokinase n=1 Tax=Lacticaseibacillus chiayiensis TaxID=2100821 RepID=UPI001010AE11|nr:1-phosphofructokinase family hexose kinase [Lacticaseibacillus chiayiensis]RXT58456.1 tagatose-6-phosphate kinase [Lacticaseibacillus chiayiensis]
MLLTITTNPSIDVVYQTNAFELGMTNREVSHYQVIGGKGINAGRVASILARNKENVAATGFVGKTNSSGIIQDLQKYGVIDEMIRVPGTTRFCYTIIDGKGQKTELNEVGQAIPNEKANQLLEQISSLTNLNGVSINGSLAPNLPKNFYSQVIRAVREKNPQAKIVLDTSGVALKSVLMGEYLPDYIKPNNEELGELLGTDVAEENNVVLSALMNPIFKNIPNVLVSMGAHGGVAKIGIETPQYYRIKISSQQAVNPEGSGDAMIGGILSALAYGGSNIDVIRAAMAAGMANAVEAKTGFVQKSVFERFLKSKEDIKVQTIEIVPTPIK